MNKQKYIVGVAFLAVACFYVFISNPLIHAMNNSSADNIPTINERLPHKTDWKVVEKAIGKAGVMRPGEVFYTSLPRNDLQVTVKGISIHPSLALGGWVAFKQMDNQTMVMGDLVLTEEEVQPVMSQLFTQGIEISAIHNHLLSESPRIMYLHIGGHGNAVQLAKAIRSGLELTKIPWNSNIQDDFQTFPIYKKVLDQIFRQTGTVSGGVYHVGIPRLDKIMENGMEIPPAMGVATTINFQPTKNGKTVITGDFVLTAEEVNPIASTLRKHGIVLIDKIEQNRKEGMSIKEAVLNGSLSRIRAILMTAAATILTLLPLAFSHNTDTVIFQTLGIVVIGGMITSTINSFIIIPIIYEWLHKKYAHNKIDVTKNTKELS
ncbi:LppY/LpqO family protein [Bacillus paramycoides]|uniref:LppY/LpqO family protein n=1 Tax=Bacillus paramycoides TaxID=2026194 RepID=UPI002E222A25|nr:efflux RND transporter permease subunit [Bacillus paramycoides]MED1412624.1 efflux RND transporter permease subunit [Bacillus paramycoides]MED1462216.1 efflux RND transporter permease subunit [Bacillus paramycoides]MED1494497.1 efflux RND transporter permease subunit [Bacillus paramycoides]